MKIERPAILADTREEVDATPPNVDYAKAQLLFAVGENGVGAEIRARDCEPLRAICYLVMATHDIARESGIDNQMLLDLVRWLLAAEDDEDGRGGFYI